MYKLTIDSTPDDMQYDITWDDVTVFILEEVSTNIITIINTTTTSTSELPEPVPLDNQDIFVYLLYGIGGLAALMTIGTIFVKKRRR